MANKNDIIKQVYYDEQGFGSIKSVLLDARKIDPTITYADVKQWKETNIERKTNLKGFNSYVAPKPFFEFQVDGFEYTFEQKRFQHQRVIGKQPKPAPKYGLLFVDIFTKYTHVEPIEKNDTQFYLSALKKGFEKMGGKPKTIYTDNDGALSSNIIQQYLKDENVKHIVTRNHASVAERQIKTIKSELDKRMEHEPKPWTVYLTAILSKYNNKHIHRTTGLTPADARKPENEIHVKNQLEINRITKRKYPDVHVGDRVKIYRKKDKMDKERVSNWDPQIRTVTEISESFGQKFYKVTEWNNLLIRSDILLLP